MVSHCGGGGGVLASVLVIAIANEVADDNDDVCSCFFVIIGVFEVWPVPNLLRSCFGVLS